MLELVQSINSYLSDYVLVILLLSVGIWYTVRTGFVQLHYLKEGLVKTFGELSLCGGSQKAGMSSFQALATAIAAQVGTGNIVGALVGYENIEEKFRKLGAKIFLEK